MESKAQRNKNRVAGSPLPRRGTCLKLWKRSDVRNTLYRVLTTPRHPRDWGLAITPSGPVHLGTMTEEDRLRLAAAALAGRQRSGAGRGAAHRVDPVLDAWVEMLLPYFSDGECCFFTGTYRDAYGYPNGMMKPTNVLRDFKRFLALHGVDANQWVVCAEPHQERQIWHCHALLADCPAEVRVVLESEWTRTRGWSDAPQLHDGGVNYVTKYALKGSDAILFDWNLS